MTPQLNGVELWNSDFPTPTNTMHKYDRGHLGIIASEDMPGATRLAASAANRIGAGVVTVLSRSRTEFYQGCLPPDIIVRVDDHIPKGEYDVLLIGPGGMLGDQKRLILQLPAKQARVIDAGALPGPGNSITLGPNSILTPHEGEFTRVFSDIHGSREERALKAANRTGACILLKGPQTLIAHPDGRLVVNDRPNPYLAKAGSGDVLAGFIAGLMAQGMDAFQAGCAGAWCHSECADRLGPGLTASDLEYTIAEVLWDLVN